HVRDRDTLVLERHRQDGVRRDLRDRPAQDVLGRRGLESIVQSGEVERSLGDHVDARHAGRLTRRSTCGNSASALENRANATAPPGAKRRSYKPPAPTSGSSSRRSSWIRSALSRTFWRWIAIPWCSRIERIVS